jgi:hypothetical protein
MKLKLKPGKIIEINNYIELIIINYILNNKLKKYWLKYGSYKLSF